MPWQWSPCAWVTITPSSRPTSAASNCWRRSGPQSTSMRSPALSTRIEVRSRHCAARAGSHWPQSLPIFGTPVDVPQPRIRTFTRPCLNNLKKLAVVASASCFRILAPQLGDEARRVGDERRLALLPAVRDRREEGRIRLDQHLVGGQPFGRRLQVLRVLEGHDARQRDVEAEVEALARKLGRAGEAMEDAGHAPLPHGALEDFGRVLLGFAGVDDQRQAGLARRVDMRLEALALRLRGRTCRNNNRARTRRSRSRADDRRPSTSAAAPRSGCASASCGWTPTLAQTSGSRSATAMISPHSRWRVEMLRKPATPRSRAFSSTSAWRSTRPS